jgi:hypothetical protein
MGFNEQLKIIKKNIPAFRLEIKKVNGNSFFDIWINNIHKKTYTSIEIGAYLNGMVDAILEKK